MNGNRFLAFLCIVCCMMSASPLIAGAANSSRYNNFSVDVGAATSTSPANRWDSATGISLGLVYRLSNNAGIRVGVERYKFNDTVTSDTYSRMPIFLGGRFYFWNYGDLWSHADLGMEMSIDQIQSSTAGASGETQTNIGGAVLYGVLYEISDHLFMGADAKIHLNKNSYWSYGIYLGMVF